MWLRVVLFLNQIVLMMQFGHFRCAETIFFVWMAHFNFNFHLCDFMDHWSRFKSVSLDKSYSNNTTYFCPFNSNAIDFASHSKR